MTPLHSGQEGSLLALGRQLIHRNMKYRRYPAAGGDNVRLFKTQHDVQRRPGLIIVSQDVVEGVVQSELVDAHHAPLPSLGAVQLSRHQFHSHLQPLARHTPSEVQNELAFLQEGAVRSTELLSVEHQSIRPHERHGSIALASKKRQLRFFVPDAVRRGAASHQAES